MDPTLVSVVRAVDGQETGLSVQPAEKKNRLKSGQEFHLECTGPGFSAFKAAAGRPAKKNATSDVISSQPIACLHEAGHVFSPTSHEVYHVIYRTRRSEVHSLHSRLL